MKNTTVLFDLDGTLLDTLDDIWDSVNEMLEKRGCPLRTREEARLFTGNGVRFLVGSALPDGTQEQEIDDAIAEYKAIYNKNMSNKTAPYDGILDMLLTLKGQGVKTGVLSNKPDKPTKELCATVFEGLIDIAMGDKPEVNRKPAPDGVLLLLEELGGDAQSACFVGDSDVDIQTAKNAGLTSVGVSWGFRDVPLLQSEGADYIIYHPSELIDILNKA